MNDFRTTEYKIHNISFQKVPGYFSINKASAMNIRPGYSRSHLYTSKLCLLKAYNCFACCTLQTHCLMGGYWNVQVTPQNPSLHPNKIQLSCI